MNKFSNIKKLGFFCAFNKILEFIKATLILLFAFVFVFQIQAEEFRSQNANITLDMENISIEKVLQTIEEKSEYFFVFNNQLINVNRTVSLKVVDASILLVLQRLFSSNEVDYDVKGSQIILSPKNKNETTELLALRQQQPKTITGKIVDAQDEPVIGANIIEKGTSNGTVTDFDGKFNLNIENNAVLIISYIGYLEQEVSTQGKNTFNIVLREDSKTLEEVVVVGYGVQKKTSTTASIASVKGDKITGSPVANINNSLVGRLPGVLSFQGSGEPGKDAATLRIRGIGTTGNANALVVIDGIPQGISSINNLNPDEIESITVLKDAAAVAPFGIGGANGVILITTKRGEKNKLNLIYNGWVGIQSPTRYPRYLDSYGYATLLNEGNKNIGLDPAYNEEELQKFKDGNDPDRYPNTDWIREVVNFNSPITKHNITLTGGSEKIRFHSSLGYLYQEGVVSVINYNRYNLSVNIDANVTANTLVSIDIKNSLSKKNEPGGWDGTTIHTDITKNPPVIPIQFTNGLSASEAFPQIYESGYKKFSDNIFYSQFNVEQKIPFISGLSLKAVVAYDKSYAYDKEWAKPITFYTLSADNEFLPRAAGPKLPQLTERFNQDYKITLQGFVTYEKKIKKNNINLLGVYERRIGKGNNFSASRMNYLINLDELSLGSSNKEDFNNGGTSNEIGQIGLVYRVNYTYDDKYLFELTGRYDGHYYFAPGKRFNFFPAFAAGWRISEESFIKNNLQWIDNLKIRGSYGTSGNLAGNPFQYLSSYGIRSSYVFGGTNYSQVQGIYERNEPNIFITWETAIKKNIGIEASFWNQKLSFELDLFTEDRSNMLVSPSQSVPSEYGIGFSQENAGEMKNKGIDLNISTYQKINKDFLWNGGFNFSFARNKLIKTFENESTFNNPNRRRTGRPLNTQFGYRAIGYFQSQEEIDSSATQFGSLIPGDIKYEDINKDGKINSEDEVVIGKPPFPEIIFGITSSLQWRGFNLNILLEGSTNVNFYLKDDAAYAFFNGAKVQDFHRDYWTPSNPHATYPVMTPSPSTNTTQQSSFWIKDASYLRLKTMDIGYRLPSSIMKILHLESIRVFTSGQNLFTLAHFRSFDPEVSNEKGRYYFQQRVVSFGLNINF